MLSNVTDIPDREYVCAKLLLNLEIELLNESRPELGRFRNKRQCRDISQVRDIRSRRSRQPLIKLRRCACHSCATRVLRSRVYPLGLFNLNCDAGLTVRTEDRSERCILQIGVRSIVAREEV